MDVKQKELILRLEELKKYQEEQECVIKGKQGDQRALLTREQIHMYEMLGLSVSNFDEITSEHIEHDFDGKFVEDNILSTSDESSHFVTYNNELLQNENANELLSDKLYEDQVNDTKIPKRAYLKRGAGLQARFRIPPDAFNLNKLPPYKYTKRVKKTLGRNDKINAKVLSKNPETHKTENCRIEKDPERKQLDLHMNVVLKIPQEPRLAVQPKPEIEEWFNAREKKLPASVETPKAAKARGFSWSQILSSNNILESSIEGAIKGDNSGNHLINNYLAVNEDDIDDTNLFHLLEERVHNISTNTSLSTIIKFMESFPKQRNDEHTILNPVDPLITDVFNLRLQPHPNEISSKVINEESYNNTGNNTSNDEESREQHVRFSENIEVVDDATDLSTDVDVVEQSQISTPKERGMFLGFKKKLLGQQDNSNEREELKIKSDLLKGKRLELDEQIASFRQQNENIQKKRQELELDKIQLQNDREDMMEQIKDNRIKIEIQLHDDKLKLEQEKQKLEKMLKTPSKRDRDEINKLKENIDELRVEMNMKESRHGSASARYRSQIKQLEKENQILKLELDVVNKDNKKLELENARLRKDTNHKMLQEINRNIAKLAPVNVSKPDPGQQKVDSRKNETIFKKRTKSVPDLQKEATDDSSDEDKMKTSQLCKLLKENKPISTGHSETLNYPSSSPSDILTELKREIINVDGSRDIWYPNGNLKKISPDGFLIRMLYFNRDIKETNVNEGTVKYYYNETNTWQTTYIDGLEIIEYPDGQIEHRYKDGTNEVHYDDGSIRITNPSWTDDKEEWRLKDGSIIKILKNNTKIHSFPNGEREIHTKNHKRREFPDGTVKIAYGDGSFETRYSNGRTRIKDSKGNLISDTM